MICAKELSVAALVVISLAFGTALGILTLSNSGVEIVSA